MKETDANGRGDEADPNTHGTIADDEDQRPYNHERTNHQEGTYDSFGDTGEFDEVGTQHEETDQNTDNGDPVRDGHTALR